MRRDSEILEVRLRDPGHSLSSQSDFALGIARFTSASSAVPAKPANTRRHTEKLPRQKHLGNASDSGQERQLGTRRPSTVRMRK